MQQTFIDIDLHDLLARVQTFKREGYRLAQACASGREELTLLYSFVRDDELVTLRLANTPPAPVDSIGYLYSYAFLYENEMKDLFGVNVVNMNIDYGGHFYDTAVKAPFTQAESGGEDNG